ncbi:MAG: single-stranded DNA-binding protein [Leptospiraceae bacterium]|nr:single-stranded DNA-binding protein [Leptospiraceae bacterium]MCZ8348079.1 single-stranded DNA-binding protein [Leptospiraceae bacterium]
MANDLNKVILIGRLTRDPEYKNINGNSLVNFSLANNRSYMVQGNKKEETNYFECEAWGKLADVIRQYATKGKQVLVEGRLKFETWDSNDGKKMSKIRIFTENLQLLGGNTGGSSSGSYPASESSYPEGGSSSFEPIEDAGGTDDDMPF